MLLTDKFPSVSRHAASTATNALTNIVDPAA